VCFAGFDNDAGENRRSAPEVRWHDSRTHRGAGESGVGAEGSRIVWATAGFMRGELLPGAADPGTTTSDLGRVREAAYRRKLSGKYDHRLITGGVGHNIPQDHDLGHIIADEHLSSWPT
jgi:hypothetical protein